MPVRDVIDELVGMGDREKIEAEHKRQSSWHKFSEGIIEEVGHCEICGVKLGTEGVELEAHHVLAYHLYPELEMERSNVVVLCRKPHDCHRLWGHLRDYSLFNPFIKECIVVWNYMVRTAKAIARRARAERKRKTKGTP